MRKSRLSLAARIALARNYARLSVADLAARIGEMTGVPIPPEQIDALERGALRVSGRLVHIAIACGVRAEWLLLDEGGMLTEEDDPVASPEREGADAPRERLLLQRWRLLPPDTKEHIYELVRSLALPMDPDYRAWELSEQARVRARDET